MKIDVMAHNCVVRYRYALESNPKKFYNQSIIYESCDSFTEEEAIVGAKRFLDVPDDGYRLSMRSGSEGCIFKDWRVDENVR